MNYGGGDDGEYGAGSLNGNEVGGAAVVTSGSSATKESHLYKVLVIGDYAVGMNKGNPLTPSPEP